MSVPRSSSLCTSVEEAARGTGALAPPRAPERPEVHSVRTVELKVGYSPRMDKLDEDHVQALVEVIDRLPPIIVDQKTMQVLDGIHRLEASRRAGRGEVQVVFFSGSETDALVVAVQANIKHGKPLSRSERQAAAALLLKRCPDRSDRWVADVCGLSHSTVGRVRQASDALELDVRTGRDGRRRPVDPAQGQAALARALEGRPSIGIREAARAAGVMPSTAHRAAARLRASHGQPYTAPGTGVTVVPAHAGILVLGSETVLERADTRAWLARTAVAPDDLGSYLRDLPLSRVYEVIDECRKRARTWAEMADSLERQVRARADTKIERAR